MNKLLFNKEIYQKVIHELLPAAEKFVWVATADIKDMHVEYRARKFDTFLAVFADLLRQGVHIRLIHAKEPGPRFREDFDRFPELIESDNFERILCPRNHMKCILIDGRIAFVGSANLTGAGMGAKSPTRRNFEAGILTDESETISQLMEFFDTLYMGDFCSNCGRRDICPDPVV
ncbi:MAG TPA: phosphatidylserine synthase [Verrucomicrobiales bacterium]|nr:phosphatidylserine synthase [Verrucomicrobiales bacterium]HIL68602.1 phosphatidylserine synthase [Verrucomicrobiota bacterium]